MIAVIDYGVNNVSSVCKALDTLGFRYKIVDRKLNQPQYTHLILPGVGSFDSGVLNLESRGLFIDIIDLVEQGVHMLGICLGMQLLFDNSEESVVGLKGLGLIKGKVVQIANVEQNLSIPHVGWNTLELEKQSTVNYSLNGTDQYFVHSFVVDPNDPDVVQARCLHGVFFPAIVKYKSVTGVQFHPEKSKIGMELIKQFCTS